MNKNKPLLRLFSWYYLIVTLLLYSVIIYVFGLDITALISVTIIWYPFLCYYLTDVKFYDNSMTITRPLLLFFSSKNIRYNEIAYMKMTEGKGTMVKIYLKGNGFRTFSPPLSKKKQQELSICLKTKEIDLVC